MATTRVSLPALDFILNSLIEDMYSLLIPGLLKAGADAK